MKHIKRHPLLISQGVCLIVLLALAFVLDREEGASLYWKFYAVIASLALLASAPGLIGANRKKAKILLAAFTLALLILPFTTLSVTKSFIQFQRQIKVGMTTREVQHLFATHFPAGGRFPRPTWKWQSYSSLQYMMDPTHDRVDSVFIYFEKGRVVKTSYMPD